MGQSVNTFGANDPGSGSFGFSGPQSNPVQNTFGTPNAVQPELIQNDFLPILMQFMQQGVQQQPFSPTPTLTPQDQQMRGDTLGNMQTLASPENFQNQTATFMDLLQPTLLDDPFEQGSAQIREQAAMTGNLASTGTTRSTGELWDDLMRNLTMASMQGAGQSIGQNMQAGGSILGDIGNYGSMNNQQFLNYQNTPANTVGSFGGGGGAPMWQPRPGSNGIAEMLALQTAMNAYNQPPPLPELSQTFEQRFGPF